MNAFDECSEEVQKLITELQRKNHVVLIGTPSKSLGNFAGEFPRCCEILVPHGGWYWEYGNTSDEAFWGAYEKMVYKLASLEC